MFNAINMGYSRVLEEIIGEDMNEEKEQKSNRKETSKSKEMLNRCLVGAFNHV